MGRDWPSLDRLLDASALRDWAHTAVSDLITHIDEINRLNVFPVADSDTGANMLFTMRSALAEANAGVGADPVRRASPGGGGPVGRRAERRPRQLRRDPVADPARHRRRHRDRGRRRRRRTAADRRRRCWGPRCGAASTWSSPRWAARRSRGPSSRCCEPPPDAVEECRDADGLAPAVTAAGDAAVVALEKTPEQLDVLADAGAVDAGGRGLLVLLDALRSTITGQAPARTVYEPSPRRPGRRPPPSARRRNSR